jgi:hypothetical protein
MMMASPYGARASKFSAKKQGRDDGFLPAYIGPAGVAHEAQPRADDGSAGAASSGYHHGSVMIAVISTEPL